MWHSLRSVVFAILGAIILANVTLIVTDTMLLVYSEKTMVVAYEGDIILRVDQAPKTGDVSKPWAQMVCTYWNGLYLHAIPTSVDYGCPIVWRG